MKPLFKKQSLKLKEKLNSLKSHPRFSDPFNYKKKVQANLIRYLMLTAKSQNCSVSKISILLKQSEDKLTAFLIMDKKQETLTNEQICELFTRKKELNSYVLVKIKEALSKLSERETNIRIRLENGEIKFQLYSSENFIRELSIEELIKIL
jgi:uncharacterized protein (DUF342 family)